MDVRVTAYGDPVVQALDERVQAEYVVRYGGPDQTEMDASEFDPPAGVFLVGWADGVAVACGGFRAHGTDGAEAVDAEVKRMFVPPEHRGNGYARLLLTALEDAARAAGYPRLILETGGAQPEAIALYASSGYVPIPGFGYYRDSPHNRCFAKLLA
jgi:GNAT superfamily N-acetyltransferase